MLIGDFTQLPAVGDTMLYAREMNESNEKKREAGRLTFRHFIEKGDCFKLE